MFSINAAIFNLEKYHFIEHCNFILHLHFSACFWSCNFVFQNKTSYIVFNLRIFNSVASVPYQAIMDVLYLLEPFPSCVHRGKHLKMLLFITVSFIQEIWCQRRWKNIQTLAGQLWRGCHGHRFWWWYNYSTRDWRYWYKKRPSAGKYFCFL